jgi:hypothetical protein
MASISALLVPEEGVPGAMDEVVGAVPASPPTTSVASSPSEPWAS